MSSHYSALIVGTALGTCHEVTYMVSLSQQAIEFSDAVPGYLSFPVSRLKRIHDAVLEAGGDEMSLTKFGATL